METFVETGQINPIRQSKPSEVYTFDENFKLIGQYFRLAKELVHMLPTYRFFYRGELYGILKKKFTFVRDQFSMEVTEGELELREYAGLIGRNFSVTLNGKMLGAIMDNLSLNMNNIVFDNSVVIAYERKYLPLLTAMAVMVARELARDED